MNEYIYTACDRLNEPHSYKYSKFEGKDFLATYVYDRVNRLQEINSGQVYSPTSQEYRVYSFLQEKFGGSKNFPPIFVKEFQEASSRSRILSKKAFLSSENLSEYNEAETIDTASLVNAILNQILKEGTETDPSARSWISRLIQRFEVSKKIYSKYLAGFRKGQGEFDRISLYLDLAITLASFCAKEGSLQGLSTLLKVNDLLLSLQKQTFLNTNLCYPLTLSVFAELVLINQLAKRKRLDFEIS